MTTSTVLFSGLKGSLVCVVEERERSRHARSALIFWSLILLLPYPSCSFQWQYHYRYKYPIGAGIAYPSIRSGPSQYLSFLSVPSLRLQVIRKLAIDNVTSPTSSEEAHLKGLVQNLFSVSAHIQNPDLYSPQWANNAILQEQGRLVASSRLELGDIVSLLPLDALGLSIPSNASKGNRRSRRNKSYSQGETKKDFVVFDQDRDGVYFQEQLSQSLKNAEPLQNDYKVKTQLSYMYDGQPHQCEIFTDINPNHPPRGPAWMGHLAIKQALDHQGLPSNCVVVPLPGAAPLCALVAITKIDEGEELVVAPSPSDDNPQFARFVASRHRLEVQELGTYLAMGYQQPLLQPIFPDWLESNDGHAEQTTNFQSPFHVIDQEYPGLRYLHRDPDILAIDNFLTVEECDQIIEQAASHLYPCVIKHPVTGEVREDPSRTSTNANLPQSDVPSIVDKLVRLTRCRNGSYLETLQIVKYTTGQSFQPHTDGFQGPTTACGFENSGRLVTIFCYLNDVPAGGETRFIQVQRSDNKNEPLSIAPRKGMAVVHFPATTGFEEDPRTEHEGCNAIDDKWLLVTWMWKNPRSQELYAESNIRSIMGRGQ
jgi:2OG-Fe(II) oxygenase superfamily